MIVDRISLNIALKSLLRIQENEGKITDILLSTKSQVGGTNKSAKFPDIATLIAFMVKYAPVKVFEDLDCVISNLYTLKSFNVSSGESNKNKIYLDDGVFVTRSSNVNNATIENLNETYVSIMDEVNTLFGKAMFNEYILEQYKYIDCGYISEYEPSIVEELKLLYNKYKEI